MATLEALRLRRQPLRTARPWRVFGWCVLGIVVVALTVLAAFPASWLADTVAARTERRVLLADAEGTLWHGSATLALSAGTGSATATVLPGRLQWTVAFWPLFVGNLRMVLNHTDAFGGPVGIRITPSGWEAQAGSARLPASLLEGIGAPFNTLRPDGRMQLDWSALQGRFFGKPGQPAGFDGHLTVRIEQVSSAVSRLRPLGSYRAEIDFAGTRGQLRLETVSGPLRLEGSGELGPRARFEGTADAEPDAAVPLAALLSLLGRRENNVTRLRF